MKNRWKTANYKCNLQFLICSCKCNLLKKWQKKLQFADEVLQKKSAIHWRQMQIAVFYLQLQLQFAEKSANKMAICNCSCNCSFWISSQILQHILTLNLQMIAEMLHFWFSGAKFADFEFCIFWLVRFQNNHVITLKAIESEI